MDSPEGEAGWELKCIKFFDISLKDINIYHKRNETIYFKKSFLIVWFSKISLSYKREYFIYLSETYVNICE